MVLERLWSGLGIRSNKVGCHNQITGGGGGNRTLSRPFREMAATRDFRGQIEEGHRVATQLVVPVSPPESPTVLPSRGEILESGGNGVPTSACIDETYVSLTTQRPWVARIRLKILLGPAAH
jgi:hypothetical protein